MNIPEKKRQAFFGYNDWAALWNAGLYYCYPAAAKKRRPVVTSIADSSAVKDSERILSQHQAALTLLQARLSAPETHRVVWLDLACGRGQIIASLDDNLSEAARRKIEYWAYDVDQNLARETGKTAKRMGFAKVEILIGDLSDFSRILPANIFFDFITLTNTIHEIEPSRLANILVSCITRLADTGILFIYDMERIKPPELGALPWSRDDIRRIVYRVLDALGASEYRPEIGRWNHKSCDGWNIQLQRQYLCISRTEASTRNDDAVGNTSKEISSILAGRLKQCIASLDALTIHGAETVEEQESKERLLYEFWALWRALEFNK
jgi:hypothetical protein